MTGLGRILQEARANKGVSLEDVENATRISRRYLEALEQEDFSVFPAPVYARGFLRSYSQYLALNPADILALYPASPLGQEPVLAQRPRAPERLPQPSRAPAVLSVVVVIVLVILGVAYIASSISGGDEQPLSRLLTSTPTGRATRTPTRLPTRTATPTRTGTPAIIRSPSGTVPELTGLFQNEAAGMLDEIGVPYVLIELPNDEVEPGTVFDQSPPTGTQIDASIAVTLLVGAEESEETTP